MRYDVKVIAIVVLMLTTAFYVGASSGKGHPGGDDEIPRKIEHILQGGLELGVRDVSDSELALLMEKEGVSDGRGAPPPMIGGMGTGLTPPTYEGWRAVQRDTGLIDGVSFAAPTALNTSKDHSASIHFPPIGNQGGEGSCVSWSIGYYTKTYQEATEHNWNLSGAGYTGSWPGYPTPSFQDRIMSPDFLYHQVNDGQKTGGSYYHDNVNVCKRTGICTWKKMPTSDSDYTSWPSEDAWRQAPLYRTRNTTYYMWVNSNSGITSLKTWIDGGNLATISIDAGKYSSLSSTTGGDLWTNATNCVETRNHANTIVGYDDNFGPYSEGGTSRTGAFKVANSWGTGWTGDSDSDGMYWISYRAMRDRVNYVFMMTDRTAYDPEIIGVFNISHNYRSDCEITLGVGNTSNPTDSKRFDDYWFDGGSYPYPNNLMVLDMTDFSSSLNDYYQKNYFLGVKDSGTTTTGSILQFTVEYYDDYANGSKLLSATSTDPTVSTVQGSTVYAEVVLKDTEYPVLISDNTPSAATTGDPLNFSAEITDNREVYGVWLEYWIGSGPHTNTSCSRGTGDSWYLNTTAPHSLDTLYYIFHFNDTTGFWNRTAQSTISVTDNDVPVFNTSALPASTTTGDMLNITINVTDNIQVADVTMEHWNDDGIHLNTTLDHIGGDLYGTITTADPEGALMTLRFKSQDTSGNRNSTENLTISILDNDPPFLVSDLTEENGTTGDTFTFSVQVWDNIGTNGTWVEYWYGSGSHTNSSMDPVGGDIFRHNITMENTLEKLSYRFHAVDTSDNWNTSMEREVNVSDNDRPMLGTDLSDALANTGDNFRFALEARDNVGLREVYLNYSVNGVFRGNISCFQAIPDEWYAVAELPSDRIGTLSYHFSAVDGSDNWNRTGALNRTIYDNDEPRIIEDLSDTSANTGGCFSFLLNVSENIGLLNVSVEYWFGEGAHIHLELVEEETGLWGGNITVPFRSLDELNYIFRVEDQAGLSNATEPVTVRVHDNMDPVIVEYPEGLLPTTGDELEVEVRVTDNIGIDLVLMNYSFGGQKNLTLEMEFSKNMSLGAVIRVPHMSGELSMTFLVIDTSNNSFISERWNFPVRDNDPPSLQDFNDTDIMLGDAFSANASSCSDNIKIASYNWTVTGPENMDLNGSSIEILPTKAGNYTVTLNVTDESGNHNTTTFCLTVSEPPGPSLEFRLEVLDDNQTVGENITISILLRNTGDMYTNVTFELNSDDEGLEEFEAFDIVLPPGFIFNQTLEVPSYALSAGHHRIEVMMYNETMDIHITRILEFTIWDPDNDVPMDDDIDDDDSSDDDTTIDDDDTGGSQGNDDGTGKVTDWLTNNYIFVIAAAMGIVLLAVLLLFMRRRKSAPAEGEWEAVWEE
ncbi:MAG: PKD domain-containing protein [Thermoplasmatota archaeon]